jgi:PKHD-type hydroxylase
MHLFGRELPRQYNENYLTAPYFVWKSCLDKDIIEKFVSIGESLSTTEATVGDGINSSAVHTNIRISTLSWIKYNEQSKKVFDALISKIDSVNFWYYGFILTGIEDIQYTRYPIGGHYVFHNDILSSRENFMRKLSVVACLSNQSDYEGGEFEIAPSGGSNPTKFKFDFGDLIAFPSYIPHRVAPVTAGHRTTVVTWAMGPKFV